MRAIDADMLINIFSNLTENDDKYTAVFVDQIIKIINEQPTVKSEKCVAKVSISKEQLETVMKPQIEELVNDCLKGISHAAKDSTLALRIKEICCRADTAEDALCEIAYEAEKYLKKPISMNCLRKERKNNERR